MGRAARHVEGKVILYADKRTKSIEAALSEIDRRRAYQVEYNKIHNITPTSIQKPLRNKVTESFDQEDLSDLVSLRKEYELLDFESSSLTPMEQKKLIAKLRREMRTAADDLNFELAIAFRDKI